MQLPNSPAITTDNLMAESCEEMNRLITEEFFPIWETAYRQMTGLIEQAQSRVANGEQIDEEEWARIQQETEDVFVTYGKRAGALRDQVAGHPILKHLFLFKHHRAGNHIWEFWLNCIYFVRHKGEKALSRGVSPDITLILVSPEDVICDSNDLVGMSNIFQLHVMKGLPDNVTLIHEPLEKGAIKVRHHGSIMTQILIELCYNAVMAMPNGGQLEFAITQNGTHAIITLRDTGIGIPAENLEQVCEQGFSTKEGGTGQGLYLTKRYIEEVLCGKFDIVSAQGVGTTITMTLPLAE